MTAIVTVKLGATLVFGQTPRLLLLGVSRRQAPIHRIGEPTARREFIFLATPNFNSCAFQ